MGKKIIYDYFENNSKKLKKHIKSRMHNLTEMDCEDVVQDVMLSMLSRSDSFLRIDNIAAYINRSLQNRANDYYKKKKRLKSLDSETKSESQQTFMELMVSHFDTSKEVEAKEFKKHLHKALKKLDHKQRAIFIETEINKKTFKELSQDWNEPIGTLLSRKSRTIKILKELLSEFNPNK